MTANESTSKFSGQNLTPHLVNVAENLQLIADLGYGDVALAVPAEDGLLHVVADARPMTALAAIASTRVGRVLERDEEAEAYEAFESGERAGGDRRRITRGISYVTFAHPIGNSSAQAVVLRDLAQPVAESPGKMEKVFMRAAEDLLGMFCEGPLKDIKTGEPFWTVRSAGDGVLRIDSAGNISYASPNAVSIMRLAGMEGRITERPSNELPDGEISIVPMLSSQGALAVEVSVADRVLWYRIISLGDGVMIFVEDLTEARKREQELKVKEATIREVHHRVKNNLQTIASLLRMQGRRAGSEEARRALAEANERVASMAVVHELLAGSTEECIDFIEAAHTVAEMVRQGLAGDNPGVVVKVKGSTGDVPAQIATSLALVVAELAHNAIEHGIAGRDKGLVEIEMRRLADGIVLTVRDDGQGLPSDFDLTSSSNLGLEIVRTVVQDDLSGTISFGKGPGTTITVRIPMPPMDTKE